MRTGPFNSIYKACNSGTMKDKLANLRKFPLLIDVELCNLCNLRCRMCPTGRGLLMRKQGFMSRAVFEKIVRECAAHNCHIRFVRWGEPLLHPNLLQFVRIIKSYGLLCHINTNGMLMDDVFISQIIKIPLDSIKFSFQGTTKDEYEKTRLEGSFTELLGWVKELFYRRHKRQLPYITIGTTITSEQVDSVKTFKKAAEKISDNVQVGKTKDIILRNTVGNNPQCPEVFDKLSIDFDGSVTACCSDYDRYMKVGDIKDKSLKEIWTDKPITYYREMLANNRHNELELCKSCIRT